MPSAVDIGTYLAVVCLTGVVTLGIGPAPASEGLGCLVYSARPAHLERRQRPPSNHSRREGPNKSGPSADRKQP